MTRRCGTRIPVAVASLVLALVGSACTADRASEPVRPSPTTETSASTAPTLRVEPGPLDVRVQVRGRLWRSERAALRRGLRRAIGGWMASGFTAGPLPRTNFSAAYASYTDGAARQARRQREVTTNTTLGPEVVELVPTRRVARVSALGVGGRAAGASAQVLLVVVGAHREGTQVLLVVRGELDLVPTGRGWKIFGFDLRRWAGAPGSEIATLRQVRPPEQRRDRNRQDRGQRTLRPGGRSR